MKVQEIFDPRIPKGYQLLFYDPRPTLSLIGRRDWYFKLSGYEFEINLKSSVINANIAVESAILTSIIIGKKHQVKHICERLGIT